LDDRAQFVITLENHKVLSLIHENEQVSESWVIVIESRIAIEKNLTKLDINYDEKKEIEVKAKSKLSLANFRANTKKFLIPFLKKIGEETTI